MLEATSAMREREQVQRTWTSALALISWPPSWSM